MTPLDYLKNITQGIKHSHSTLYEHCYNVYVLLKNMERSQDVCLAGLYHSIYGNEYFKPPIKVTRAKIRALIGKKAEALVYTYNNTKDRDNYYLKNADKYKDLFLMCYINLLDMDTGNPDSLINRYVDKYKMISKSFKVKRAVQVKDNLLSAEEFNKLKNLILSNEFPWYFSDGKVDDDNIQFVHHFVFSSLVYSPYIESLHPIFGKLKAKRIFRAKLNYTFKTPKLIQYDYHQDVNIACKTAVFYLNTNNGYTQIKNGRKIESKENRIVMFNSNAEHAGSSCTDQKYRVLLNINYV